MSAATDVFNKGNLERFAKSLAQAIYDRTLEQENEIKFYYDADALYWMVLGFRNFGLSLVKPSSKTLLMRALLSAGYLGKAYALRPHVLELDSLIRRQPEFGSQRSEESFAKSVKLFIRSAGIDKNLARLLEIARSDLGEDLKTQHFLQELQETAAETFVSIELSHGSWQERLRRLHGPVLGFDGNEGDVKKLLGSSEVWYFNRALSQERGDKKLSPNNFRDAVALAILKNCVDKQKSDDRAALVRFHTDSGTLKKVWEKDEEIRGFLSYDVPDGRWDTGFIFRDLDYFILRASFDSLHFRGVVPRKEDGAASILLSDLAKVLEELTEAMDGADDEALERAAKIKIGDRLLTQVIWDLESLSFIRSIWGDYKPPEALKRLMLGLAEVWAFADKGATRQRLKTEIKREVEGLRRELGERVIDFRNWFTLFRQVQNQADKLRKKLKSHEIPEPMRDLGLVRWNVKPSEDLEHQIRDAFESLLSPEEEAWTRSCAAFTSMIEAVEDEDGCLLVCSVMWSLAMFDRVVVTINRLEDNSGGQLSPSLLVMRSAARLRGRDTFSRTEKRRHIAALVHLKDKLSGVERGRLLLGLGYVTYYAWYSERSQPSLSSQVVCETPEEPEDDWSRMSFEMGEEAVGLLLSTTDRLGWAFAVNHCAYVGAVTSVEPGRTSTFLRLLAEIRGEDDIWHYRFADTLAYSDYLEAARLWKQVSDASDDSSVSLLLKRACERLKSAEEMLADMGPYFGDPEIPQHRLQVEQLKRAIGC